MNAVKANLAVLALAVTASPAVLAAGDANAGEQKSQVCVACHGADGHGTNPTYPVLAGQHADYLEHALKAYREGTRTNPIMAGMAGALSDQDIEDLAAYYAGMNGLRDLKLR